MFIKFSQTPTNRQISKYFHHVASSMYIKDYPESEVNTIISAANAIRYSDKDFWPINQDKILLHPSFGYASSYLNLHNINEENQLSIQLFDDVNGGYLALTEVPGIGYKLANKLSKELGLTHYHSAISKLIKSLKQGELTNIHVSEDLKLHISKCLSRYIASQKTPSYTLFEADLTHLQIQKQFANINLFPTGVFRRRYPLINKVSYLANKNNYKLIIEKINSDDRFHLIDAGTDFLETLFDETRISFSFAAEELLPITQFYLTGPLQHIKYLKSQNHELSPLSTFKSEDDIYSKLEVNYFPPEVRHLITTTQKSETFSSKLIELDDIRGDFHLHSSFATESDHDDGVHSMTDFISQSIELNYNYLGFSEHNPSYTRTDLSRRVELVKSKKITTIQLNNSYLSHENSRMKVFNCLEIDITKDGLSLLDEELWHELDFGIVSIHNQFDLSSEENTTRIINALRHPKALILGHPTGRTLRWRLPIHADWNTIFSYCANNHKFLEINAWPDRQDLPEKLILEARKYGCKFVIGSDAHQKNHMTMIKYGVEQARRAGLKKNDILNTYSLEKIEELVTSINKPYYQSG